MCVCVFFFLGGGGGGYRGICRRSFVVHLARPWRLLKNGLVCAFVLYHGQAMGSIWISSRTTKEEPHKTFWVHAHRGTCPYCMVPGTAVQDTCHVDKVGKIINLGRYVNRKIRN